MSKDAGIPAQAKTGEAKEGGIFGVGSNHRKSVIPLMLSNGENMPEMKEIEAADGLSDGKVDEQDDE